MSVAVMSLVFKNSEARLGARLVLLVLADHAHDDGSNAYPSQAKIAEKARMTARQVRRCLKELEAAGEIARAGVEQKGVIKWQIDVPKLSAVGQIVPGHIGSPPRTNRADERSEMSYKPSSNHQQPSGRTGMDSLVK